MGRNVTYEILDKGTIKVVVGAYDTSATICWKYSATICEDGCNSATTISTECITVPIEPYDNCGENPPSTEPKVNPEVSFTWNEQTIKYQITQLPRDCEKCGKIATRYELTDYWLVPSVIYCDSDPSSKGKLYFEYYEIQEDDCQVISKKKKLGESAFTYDVCDNVDETVHKEKNMTIKIPEENEDPNISYTVVCEYDCAACTNCTPNSAAIIVGNITYDKDYVLCSGTTAENPLNCTINYSIVQYDSDCKKHITNKVKNIKWVVANCKANHTCCEDHYVITSETITETVGEQTLAATASLSILMKSNFSGINSCDACGDNTDFQLKYCVSKGTTFYKTLINGEYEWVELNTDKSNALPKEGGEIKVKFDYSAYTSDERMTSGTTEKILTIPMSTETCENPPKKTESSFLYGTFAHSNACNSVKFEYYQFCGNS